MTDAPRIHGDTLMVGWDNILERASFALAACASLRALGPFPFLPLGQSRYLTDTPYRGIHEFHIWRAPHGETA
jgi:hypothetical protein